MLDGFYWNLTKLQQSRKYHLVVISVLCETQENIVHLELALTKSSVIFKDAQFAHLLLPHTDDVSLENCVSSAMQQNSMQHVRQNIHVLLVQYMH